MDTFLFTGVFAIACLACGVAARPFDKRISMSAVLLFGLYLALDDLATGLPHLVQGISVPGGHWNWSGKLLSLLLSVAVIGLLRMSPDALGLRMRQQHPTLAWLSLVAFAVWGAALGLFFKPGIPDIETLAFQGTMPGLAEELAYRGIAPAILLGLIHRKPHVEGIPWAVVFSTAAIFGIWHSLSVSGGDVRFDAMSGVFPFLGSIPSGWLRFKTGSLLVPVLGHAVAKAFHVAGGWGA